jgi:hypothetical protein
VYFAAGLLDLEGNSIGASGQFTTSTSPVTTPPSVVLLNPPAGFINVPIDIVPQVLFNDPLNGTTSAITLSAGGTILNTINTLGSGNRTVSLTPPGLLQPSTAYVLMVGAVTDTSGNTVPSPLSFDFTTGTGASLGNPSVVTLFPANNASGVSLSTTVTAVFTAPMDALTFNASNFLLIDPLGAAVAGALSISPDGLTVIFVPSAALTPNAVDNIGISSLTDLAGNTVLAASGTFMAGAQ